LWQRLRGALLLLLLLLLLPHCSRRLPCLRASRRVFDLLRHLCVPVVRPQALAGDIVRLPYRSACADVVLCVAVLHHISTLERRRAAVSELLRVLRPGGDLFVQVVSAGGVVVEAFGVPVLAALNLSVTVPCRRGHLSRTRTRAGGLKCRT
jgi:SAM-dependent methyltransferase